MSPEEEENLEDESYYACKPTPVIASDVEEQTYLENEEKSHGIIYTATMVKPKPIFPVMHYLFSDLITHPRKESEADVELMTVSSSTT